MQSQHYPNVPVQHGSMVQMQPQQAPMPQQVPAMQMQPQQAAIPNPKPKKILRATGRQAVSCYPTHCMKQPTFADKCFDNEFI